MCPTKPLLSETQPLDAEIATARSIYTANSPFPAQLVSAREKLQPAAAAQELEAWIATRQQADGSIRGIATPRLAGTTPVFRSQPGAAARKPKALQSKLPSPGKPVRRYQKPPDRSEFQGLEIARATCPGS